MLDAGTAVAVETMESAAPVATENDPLAPRWYLNAIEREARVNGFECGFSIVKYADWGLAQNFTVPEEFHTIDDNPNLPKERLVQHPALDVQRQLEAKFAGKDMFGNVVQNKVNKGLQIGFIGETDTAKMKVISETLLPTLPRIRELAEELQIACPIEAMCAGQDDLDFSERMSCPTCWLGWVNSDLCTAYMDSVATNGREVFDVDAPDTRWVVRPTVAEFDTARNLTRNNLQVGLRYLQNEWRTIASEVEKGTRNGLDEGGYQHAIRKDVHEVKPQDRELRLIRETAKANMPGDNTAVLGRVVDVLDRMDQRLLAMETKVPTPPTDAPFAVNETVWFNGEAGVIKEAKAAGWFVIETDSGTKTVRKGELTREDK